MQQKRDELVARGQLPQAVLNVAVVDPATMKLGAQLNKAYTAALRMGNKGQFANILERAKAIIEDYLAHFPIERRGRVSQGHWLVGMRGKMVGRIRPCGWRHNLNPVCRLVTFDKSSDRTTTANTCTAQK